MGDVALLVVGLWVCGWRMGVDDRCVEYDRMEYE